MKVLSFAVLSLGIFTSIYSQTCVGGKWDVTSNVWFTDCTSYDQWDGRYYDGPLPGDYSATADGDTIITLANASNQHIYWRLYYYDNIIDTNLPIEDSIPLLAGVHCWSNSGSTLDQLLESGNTYLGAEPGVYRVISLTFSINISENNSGTWWWGTSVGGVPTPWAEDIVVKIIKQRLSDACQILAASGAPQLANKHVDVNRVYLRGHSMGGTGAYRIGIKHPELFSAIFCHAGFADFKGPCGAFTDGFNNMVGTSGQQCTGIDGSQYVARDYTDMSWFISTHKGASWETAFGNGKKFEPPYVNIRHGTNDAAVDIASADRLHTALENGNWGYTYQRDGGEHSDNNGTRSQWMLSMRKNQSYLGFSGNSTNTSSQFNYLSQIGWVPSSIVDQTDHYEVQLTGSSGTTNVTLHRLQNFVVTPSKAFHYWIGTQSGGGTAVTANAEGFLTLNSIAAGSKIIIEPDVPTQIENDAGISNESIIAQPNPFNPAVIITITNAKLRITNAELKIFNTQGKLVKDLTPALRNSKFVIHNSIPWDASDMPSGLYVVKVLIGTRTLTKAITLIK